MSQPVAVLGRVEKEVSALLVAGLVTQRGGRERLETLASEASALKMERLAQELRSLSQGQDPTALANGAFTCLAMARKLKERLVPWPEVSVENAVLVTSDPPHRVALPEAAGENPDPSTLAHWMESGDELLRSHTAGLLVKLGGEAVPELARLAAKGTTTVRREAIRALGGIGGDEVLQVLLGLPDVSPCWRVLLEAILPYGEKVVPPLAAILAEKPSKKNQERRRMAAALLYRLGALDSLRGPVQRDEDQIVLGFAFAARSRVGKGWDKVLGAIDGLVWEASFTALIVTVAEAEAPGGQLHPVLEAYERGAVNEVRQVGRWALVGSPVEHAVALHFLEQTAGGNAKSRQRATSLLCGLAYPPLVPMLAARIRSGEIEPALAANVLGETGGSQAVGVLLDMLAHWNAGQQHIEALKSLGDPGTAPAIVSAMDALSRPGARKPSWGHSGYFEGALASLGDGVATYLGRELRSRRATPTGDGIQRALLQMKGPRAKKALEGIDTGSIEALVSRLGHPNISQDAVKALVRKRDEAVEPMNAVLQTNNLSACKDALAVLDGVGTQTALRAVYATVERRLPAIGNAQNTDEQVCAQGIEILSKRRKVDALALFTSALDSGSYRVAGVAAEAIVKAGEAAVPHVMPLLDSSNAIARTQALNIAAKFRVAAAEEKAVALLTDKDHSVQTAATFVLGELGSAGSQRAAQALGEALVRGGLLNPWMGIHSLAKTGQRAVIPYLRKFAESHKYYSHHVDQAIKQIEAASPSPSGLASKLKGLFGGTR